MPAKAIWKGRRTLKTYLHGSRQDEWKENCLKWDTVQTFSTHRENFNVAPWSTKILNWEMS